MSCLSGRSPGGVHQEMCLSPGVQLQRSPWVQEVVHKCEQHENNAEQASFMVVKDITLALKSFKDSAALCPSRSTHRKGPLHSCLCWQLPTITYSWKKFILLFQIPSTFYHPLSSRIKSVYDYANKQGFSACVLCFYAWGMPQCTKKRHISLKHLFFKIPGHSFLQKKYEPEAICYFLWNISPVWRGWLLRFLLPLHMQRKKRQLMATRTFSSVYWSPQLPHEALPEDSLADYRQFSLIPPS